MASRISIPTFQPQAWALACALGVFAVTGVQAQSSAQIQQAEKAAQDGVPLSALAANAPDSYTVKRGDTLWAISGMFLKSPWRWPELWGMNKAQIKNPHWIYPGQVLFLDKSNGRARLRVGQTVGSGGAVKLSPQVRISKTDNGAILPIANSVIEPFLSQAIIVDAKEFAQAPRVVAGVEERTLFSQGDRAYVRAWRKGDLSMEPGTPLGYRIYRNATPLKDPETGEILAYEAHYLARAQLVRPAGQVTEDGVVVGQDTSGASPVKPLYNNNKTNPGVYADGKPNTAINPETGYPYNTDLSTSQGPSSANSSDWRTEWRSSYKGTFDNKLADEKNTNIMPATIDIVSAREEVNMGDRLAADIDLNAMATYLPHAAPSDLRARVISVYSGEENGAQNQIIVLNKGLVDGVDRGSVFTLLNKGVLLRDRTDTSAPLMRLPNEVNGQVMVFSVFDRVSYGLVLQIKNPVRSGDMAIDPNLPENEMKPD